MKLSVSLSDEHLAFVDEQIRTGRLPSRSAVIARALRLMQARSLADDYADAWREWAESGEESTWDTAVGDGITK